MVGMTASQKHDLEEVAANLGMSLAEAIRHALRLLKAQQGL